MQRIFTDFTFCWSFTIIFSSQTFHLICIILCDNLCDNWIFHMDELHIESLQICSVVPISGYDAWFLRIVNLCCQYCNVEITLLVSAIVPLIMGFIVNVKATQFYWTSNNLISRKVLYCHNYIAEVYLFFLALSTKSMLESTAYT